MLINSNTKFPAVALLISGKSPAPRLVVLGSRSGSDWIQGALPSGFPKLVFDLYSECPLWADRASKSALFADGNMQIRWCQLASRLFVLLRLPGEGQLN